MSPARARTWTARSGVERTNHKATTPSSIQGLISKYQNGTPKVARKALYIGGSGTQFVVMVTKRFSLYCGAHKKLAEISFFIIFDQNLVYHMTLSLGNLHILKTLISLERKVIFGNSKQPFSSHSDYLFMF